MVDYCSSDVIMTPSGMPDAGVLVEMMNMDPFNRLQLLHASTILNATLSDSDHDRYTNCT